MIWERGKYRVLFWRFCKEKQLLKYVDRDYPFLHKGIYCWNHDLIGLISSLPDVEYYRKKSEWYYFLWKASLKNDIIELINNELNLVITKKDRTVLYDLWKDVTSKPCSPLIMLQELYTLRKKISMKRYRIIHDTFKSMFNKNYSKIKKYTNNHV